MGRVKTRIVSLEQWIEKTRTGRALLRTGTARRFLRDLARVYGDGQEPSAAELDQAAETLEADAQAALDRVYGGSV